MGIAAFPALGQPVIFFAASDQYISGTTPPAPITSVGVGTSPVPVTVWISGLAGQDIGGYSLAYDYNSPNPAAKIYTPVSGGTPDVTGLGTSHFQPGKDWAVEDSLRYFFIAGYNGGSASASGGVWVWETLLMPQLTVADKAAIAAAQQDAFPLFTFSLVALQNPGLGVVSLRGSGSDAVDNDGLFTFLYDLDGNPVAYTVHSDLHIPEPLTAWVPFAVLLAGLIRFRLASRRHKPSA